MMRVASDDSKSRSGLMRISVPGRSERMGITAIQAEYDGLLKIRTATC